MIMALEKYTKPQLIVFHKRLLNDNNLLLDEKNELELQKNELTKKLSTAEEDYAELDGKYKHLKMAADNVLAALQAYQALVTPKTVEQAHCDYRHEYQKMHGLINCMPEPPTRELSDNEKMLSHLINMLEMGFVPISDKNQCSIQLGDSFNKLGLRR